MSDYSSIKTYKIIDKIYSKKSSYWNNLQEAYSINLFNEAWQKIEAYRDFLESSKFDYKAVRTNEDFSKVPLMNKGNYLKKYPVNKLIWGNDFNRPLMYTATSGTTGTPTYFVRGLDLEWRCSVFMEYFLHPTYEIGQKVLVIDCFGMGVWIGGLITYRAFEMYAYRYNLPISIITPGVNKKEIFQVLNNLAGRYDVVVFAGYPPFIKDVIDEANELHLLPRNIDVKIKFAAESFSENFRDYIYKSAHMENVFLDTVNVYGSAELGAMALEGPTSILIKRLINENKKLKKAMYGIDNISPTLAQYIPDFVNFESVDNKLIVTGNSAIPLIRYSIGDVGGVLTFDEVSSIFNDFGINLMNEAKKQNLLGNISRLPFVYVYERDDMTISFYGLKIYSEWIKKGLLTRSVNRNVTGKFMMATRHDDKLNQYVEIVVELRKSIKPTTALYDICLKSILHALKISSSEFRELYSDLKDKANPKLIFRQYEDSTFFKVGAKQKWVT